MTTLKELRQGGVAFASYAGDYAPMGLGQPIHHKAMLENRKAVEYLVSRLSAETEKKDDPDVKERP